MTWSSSSVLALAVLLATGCRTTSPSDPEAGPVAAKPNERPRPVALEIRISVLGERTAFESVPVANRDFEIRVRHRVLVENQDLEDAWVHELAGWSAVAIQIRAERWAELYQAAEDARKVPGEMPVVIIDGRATDPRGVHLSTPESRVLTFRLAGERQVARKGCIELVERLDVSRR